jgi:hypothetical protein
MIQVRAFDMAAARLSMAPSSCALALPWHGFARLPGYGRREAMRFGIFDIEGFHARLVCKVSEVLPFYRHVL